MSKNTLLTPLDLFDFLPTNKLIKQTLTNTLDKPFDFFNFKVYVTTDKFFKVSLPDIIPKSITFTNNEDVIKFERERMRVYQNQFNMAVWCVTAGCGISLYDVNFNGPLGNLGLTVYRFHLYYQIRKNVKYLVIPLPGDDDFNKVNNGINMTNYGFIKKEFNISDHKDFYIDEPLPHDYNPHYNWWSTVNENWVPGTESKPDYTLTKDWEQQRDEIKAKGIFEKKLIDRIDKFMRIKYNKVIDDFQQPDYPRYMKFIPKTTSGLTPAGLVRLNDSIRAFVNCVLEAQTGARSSIVGNSTASLIAQKHFLNLVENKINEKTNASDSIDDYQKIVSDTHVRLDYVIGPNLYIISSNMVLNQGVIDTYNNKIKVANSSMTPGKNDINKEKRTVPPLMAGETVKTQRTKVKDKTDKTVTKKTETKDEIPQTETEIKAAADDHENMKFIIFGVASALVGLALLLR